MKKNAGYTVVEVIFVVAFSAAVVLAGVLFVSLVRYLWSAS